MNCPKCGKECANNTGLAAHMRRCRVGEEATPVVEQPQEEAQPTKVEAVMVLLEAKGWSAIFDGEYKVTDKLGRTVGVFPEGKDAIRFLENSIRWIK